MRKLISILLSVGILLSFVIPVTSFADDNYAINWNFNNGETEVFDSKGSTVSLSNDDGWLKIQSTGDTSLKKAFASNTGVTDTMHWSFDAIFTSANTYHAFGVSIAADDTANSSTWMNILYFWNDGSIKTYGKINGSNSFIDCGLKYSNNVKYHIDVYLDMGSGANATHKLRLEMESASEKKVNAFAYQGYNSISADYVRGFWEFSDANANLKLDNIQISNWNGYTSDEFFQESYSIVSHSFDAVADLPTSSASPLNGLYVNQTEATPFLAKTGVIADGRKTAEINNGSSNKTPSLFYNVGSKSEYLQLDFKTKTGGFWFCTRHPSAQILLSANANVANKVYSKSSDSAADFTNDVWYRVGIKFDYTNNQYDIKLINLSNNELVIEENDCSLDDANNITQFEFMTWYSTDLFIDNILYGPKLPLSIKSDTVEGIKSDGVTLELTNPINPAASGSYIMVNGDSIPINADSDKGVKVPFNDNNEATVEYNLYDMFGQNISGTATIKAKKGTIEDFETNKNSLNVSSQVTITSLRDDFNDAILLTVVYDNATRQIVSVDADISHSLFDDGVTNLSTDITLPSDTGYRAITYLWDTAFNCDTLAAPLTAN